MQQDIFHPARLTVDYPDRQLNRTTTFFRLFAAVPIVIVLSTVAGGNWQWSYENGKQAAAAAGACCSSAPC